MRALNWLAVISIVSLFPLASSGCTEVECGDGTAEKDGVCQSADQTSQPNGCAAGTHWDATELACVPDLAPAICDPLTTIAEVDEDGVTHCVGIGGIGGCSIACRNPDPGKITVCGQLVNAQDSVHIGDGGSGARCDLDAPADSGPCSIKLQFFDALQFAANPTGAPELVPDEVILNDCGAYMGHNVPTPMLGFIAVAGDDHPSSGVDIWARSGAASAVVAGQKIVGENTHVVANTTDALWTANAGDPFMGQSFWERGAYFPIFLVPDTSTPEAGDLVTVAGVKVVVNGSVEVDLDYYFTDTDPKLRTTPSATQDATGANGSALVVDSDLVNHTGQGGEPTDTAADQLGVPCVWPEDLGDAIPGVYFALERAADNSVTGENCQ